MKKVLRIPVSLLLFWAGASLLMGAWAYLSFPPEEFRSTMFASGLGLIVILIMGVLGKFDRKEQRPGDGA